MFNFTEAKRGKLHGGNRLPDGTLRFTNKTLSVSGDFVNRSLNSTRYKTESGFENVRLAVEFDTYNQAFRVTAGPEGFVARLADGSDTAYMALPVSLKRSGMPVGDYKLVSGETNIFQLAR